MRHRKKARSYKKNITISLSHLMLETTVYKFHVYVPYDEWVRRFDKDETTG